MRLTIDEVLEASSFTGFEKFCKDFVYSEGVVNEGGGHLEVNMTLEQARKYDIVTEGEYAK